MPVSAISAQVTSNAHAAGAPKPKCQATPAESTPVASSTSGYRTEIGALQEAQRPRSTSQLITGMLCRALICALQVGQAERGVLKLKRPSGAGTEAATGVEAASGAFAAASPAVDGANSAACVRHSRSSMIGRR